MSKKRKILLIEPNYKNKYPPIGLMKISTYHRHLGDSVEFFKGDMNNLIISNLSKKCISELTKLDSKRNWHKENDLIKEFIRKRNHDIIEQIVYKNTQNRKLVIEKLNYYSDIYRKKQYSKYPKWDRIYVTSLFTFYWKITVGTIHVAKLLVKDPEQIMVGGVLASLLHKELEIETGIKSHKGLLDTPGLLDPNNKKAENIIIDNLALDYSILEETEYEYPTGSAYFTFMTKGCTRKCAFCSVPILEPTYKPKIETIDKFAEIKSIYGEQQHLLLMDNNVLASPNFPEIIEEIKQMGFYKGATYVEPNQLEIAIRNLKNGLNDTAYIKRSQRLYSDFPKRLKGLKQEEYISILKKFGIDNIETTTKKALLSAYDHLRDLYEQYRNKQPRLRYVDFNQGTDARYLTDELMKLMSEIPIRPLRIAFDYWGLREKYESAIRLAARYNVKELSNYILYNFNDTPEELYKRLELNINLNEELGTNIFSFPMKYIPLFGEEAKVRTYIGKKWNKKFIRSVQSILNVTKGIVAPGKGLFERAFGRNLEEFNEILFMPEEYIVYRYFFDQNGFIDAWKSNFRSLTDEERSIANEIICSNNFKDYEAKISNPKLISLFKHYTIKKEQIGKYYLKDLVYKETKKHINKLIKSDSSVNLTLTYDFENDTVKQKRLSKVGL